MSKTFEMPVDAKKGCLKLANEMLRVGGETLLRRDDLVSLAAKVAASMDTESITLEPGEVIAMLALGECSNLLQISMSLNSVAGEDYEDRPELSVEQVIRYSQELLSCAPPHEKDGELYQAVLGLLNKAAQHKGGGCELSATENAAYKTIKNMYYKGSFGGK